MKAANFKWVVVWVLIALVWLTTWLTPARGQGLGGGSGVSGGGIGVGSYFLTPLLYHTNNVLAWSPLVIGGASVTAFNGTYVLSSSNFVSGLARVIWTNSTSSKILYMNDPGANVFGFTPMLESMANDPNGYYSGSEGVGGIPAAPFSAFAGTPGDTITITYVTNAIVTSLQAITPTNATFIGSSTNLFVDPVNGNDTYASRTNRIPFQTIAAAFAVATNGDTINLTTATYTENTVVTAPNGVILNGNNSVISNVFTFTDNDEVYGVRKFGTAPHFNITNATSRSIFKFGIATGASGDGIDVDSANGLVQFYNIDNGSYWDACVLAGLKSNAVVEFYNCRQASVFQSGIGNIVQGSHALTWYVDGNGGKVRISGGSLTVLNATNLTFTGPYGNNNSCFSIVNPNGQTNIGNASVEFLNLPTIAYGTTNAGVWITAITNSLNVPIYGAYMDSKIGSSLASPNVTNTLVFLDPVSGNGSGWTNLNGANIAAGTVPNTALANPSYFPSPSLPGSSYAKNRFVQMAYPNAGGLGVFGMSPPSAFAGTIAAFPPVAGLPLGVQYSQAAGGICGVNVATPTVLWSSNDMKPSWSVSLTTDVSSNRIWCCISSLAPAGADQPFRCFGFRRSHTFSDVGWVAYSNDSTVTNNIATGVSVAIGTYYHLAIAKTNTSLTYYINGAQVATATWNPTPVAVRENWCNNALNSQASGLVLHNYYNDYTP